MYYYLLINFSDAINECRRLYPDNDFVFMQDSAPSHRAKATQIFKTTRPISLAHKKGHRIRQIWIR